MHASLPALPNPDPVSCPRPHFLHQVSPIIPVSRGFPRPNARAVAARRTAAGPGGPAAHLPRHLGARHQGLVGSGGLQRSDRVGRIGSGGTDRANRSERMDRVGRIGRIGASGSDRADRSAGGSDRSGRPVDRIGADRRERIIGSVGCSARIGSDP